MEDLTRLAEADANGKEKWRMVKENKMVGTYLEYFIKF